MIRIGWYKISKSYRNNEQIWGLYVSRKMSKDFYSENDMLENIGENTDGGQNYGYKMKSRYLGKNKPKNTDLLLRKPSVCFHWEIKKNNKEDLHFLI